VPERAKRVGGLGEVDDKAVCYWRTPEGVWMLYLPMCGAGNLARHTVTEHEDGTISVSPSIRMNGHPLERHGFLVRGEWRDA